MMFSDLEDVPTPFLLVDEATVRRNIERMAAYGREHGLAIRPHTKTHKSRWMATLQTEAGAVGLTVAKVGEAEVMAELTDDLLIAYPAVDRHRTERIAKLAGERTVRVGIDSVEAADALDAAARRAGTTIGILADVDVGHHRTGVGSPEEAVWLAQHVDRCSALRLDGLMCFPGHINPTATDVPTAVREYGAVLRRVIDAWEAAGLNARIVSGGSTPTAFHSHLCEPLTEIRPGTSIYNDVDCVLWDCATEEDCAARVVCTVVSTTVPGKAIIDAGSKTLTFDPCAPDTSRGFGQVVELPGINVARLSEEHGELEIDGAERRPRVGDRLTVIPNHICPCVNLQDRIVLRRTDGQLESLPVDARGRLS